jgi:hypothetical protein
MPCLAMATYREACWRSSRMPMLSGSLMKAM